MVLVEFECRRVTSLKEEKTIRRISRAEKENGLNKISRTKKANFATAIKLSIEKRIVGSGFQIKKGPK